MNETDILTVEGIEVPSSLTSNSVNIVPLWFRGDHPIEGEQRVIHIVNISRPVNIIFQDRVITLSTTIL